MLRCRANRLFETWTGRGWRRRSATASRAIDSVRLGRNGQPADCCWLQRSRCGIQHRVDELGIGPGSDRPADDLPVVAIDHRGQVYLAGRDLELRDVGQPLLVRRFRAEIPIQQVLGHRADLAHVRAVSTAPPADGNQRLLFHQATNDLLGYSQRLVAERGVQPPIAVAPVVAIEDVDQGTTDLPVLVGRVEPGQVIEERTARQDDCGQQLIQRVGRPQGINQRRLLPVCQEPLIDAQIFF